MKTQYPFLLGYSQLSLPKPPLCKGRGTVYGGGVVFPGRWKLQKGRLDCLGQLSNNPSASLGSAPPLTQGRLRECNFTAAGIAAPTTKAPPLG